MAMRKLLLVGALLAIAGCDYFSSTETRLAQADKAVATGDYNAAAIMLRNITAKEPANPKAQLLLARTQILRGEAAAADAALSAAANAKADPAAVDEMRAQLAISRRQFQELIVDLDAGRYALPTPLLERYRARAMQGLGSVVDALGIYDRLLEIEPDSIELLVYAAECHAVLGRVKLALAQVDKALTIKPDAASAWMLRAKLLQSGDAAALRAAQEKTLEYAPGQLGVAEQAELVASTAVKAIERADKQNATAAHERLIRLAPQMALTGLVGAQVDIMNGNASAAVITLQKLLQNAPDYRPGRPALIGALLMAGNLELAVQESATLAGSAPDQARLAAIQAAVKAAASAEPGSEDRILKTAAAAMSLEQTSAARGVLEEAQRSHPDSIPIEGALIQLQLRAGKNAEALQRAQALARSSHDDRTAMILLAAAQAANGDLDAAAASYEKLLAGAPSAPLVVALAETRLRSGKGDALAPLSQWLSNHPTDVAVRMLLASAAQRSNQYDRARAEYEILVAQASDNAVALNNLAWLYSMKGDSRALATARRAYEHAATSPSVADTYGWLLARSGDVKAALPILSAAAGSAPANPAIRYHLAAALARSGQAADRSTGRRLLADLLRDEAQFEGREEAERLLGAYPEP